MRLLFLLFIFIFFFFGCSDSKKTSFNFLPNTSLVKKSFSDLPYWEQENYDGALNSFVMSCKSSKTKKRYGELCKKAKNIKDAKTFFETYFLPYQIVKHDGTTDGLLTGYYEAELYGSLVKTDRYKYPIYKTPKDLIEVNLGSIYPDLKHYRLRGRLEGNKIVPYYTREEIALNNPNAEVICYVDSKIDLFFLEIQGSGRVRLENGKFLFVGYANQNGHKYRAIGRYLVQIGALQKDEVSLQSIKQYLLSHPENVDTVLNYNKSVVYFSLRKQAATGALGIELIPYRSVAVDRKYIPLGSLLFLHAQDKKKRIDLIVNAHDTGGAIKGAVRADLFLGYGDKAMHIAGRLKADLELWFLLPKKGFE